MSSIRHSSCQSSDVYTSAPTAGNSDINSNSSSSVVSSSSSSSSVVSSSVVSYSVSSSVSSSVVSSSSNSSSVVSSGTSAPQSSQLKGNLYPSLAVNSVDGGSSASEFHKTMSA